MVASFIVSMSHVLRAGAGTLIQQSSGAQSGQSSASGFSIGSLILCILMVLVLAACIMSAFKIYVAVRGGKIAQGWFLFVVGFGLLGLAQVILLASQMTILPVSTMLADALRAVALIVILIGAGRLRKLLT